MIGVSVRESQEQRRRGSVSKTTALIGMVTVVEHLLVLPQRLPA
jgi:hypothetical protein